MLQYPATLADRPLLRFALENLADGSPLGLACYDAVLPLGMLHNAILRYQDHWSVVSYHWKHPVRTSSPISPPVGQPLDWSMMHRRRMHYTMLILTTTSSAWITKGGTANFGRKRSGEETPGRMMRFSAHSKRARNGSIWTSSCAS